MTIRFDCPVCGHSLKCAEEVAGKRVKCTRCAAITTAPTPIAHPEIVTDKELPAPSPQPQTDSVQTNVVTTTAAPVAPPPAPSGWQAVEQPTTNGSITSAAPPILSARAQVIHPHERDDEDDDREWSRRSRRSRRDDVGFRCPFCGTDEIPLRQSKIATTGWIVFAVLLLLFWPLFFIGLLIKEEHKVCAECGMKLD
jgi:hypothetical protein